MWLQKKPLKSWGMKRQLSEGIICLMLLIGVFSQGSFVASAEEVLLTGAFPKKIMLMGKVKHQNIARIEEFYTSQIHPLFMESKAVKQIIPSLSCLFIPQDFKGFFCSHIR